VVVKGRRAARVLALQALYELDCTHHPVGEVMSARLEETPLAEDPRHFSYQLVNGVLEHKTHLDQLIREHAPEWPLEQIAVIDRNIMRIAVFEFVVSGLTPIKVAIDEAIELSKEYGAESTARFVNGVLGALAAGKGKPEGEG